MEEKIYLIIGIANSPSWGEINFIEDWFATKIEAEEYMKEYRKNQSNFYIDEVKRIDWEDYIKDNDKYNTN